MVDIPKAQDEYDSYIPGIYSRLIRRVSQQDLFEHLWEIEAQHMGLAANYAKTEAVAEKLVALNSQL